MDAVDRWHESPLLRDEIRAMLREWGAWSRADAHNLRFHNKTPGLQLVSNSRSPAINVERAEATEWLISSWNATSPLGKRAAFILKLVYVERKSSGDVRHHFNRKFRTRLGLDEIDEAIDTAELAFYLLMI